MTPKVGGRFTSGSPWPRPGAMGASYGRGDDLSPVGHLLLPQGGHPLLKKKRFAWLALLLVFGLVAAACGDDDEGGGDGGDGAPRAACPSASPRQISTRSSAPSRPTSPPGKTPRPWPTSWARPPSTPPVTSRSSVPAPSPAPTTRSSSSASPTSPRSGTQEPTVGVSYTSSPEDNAIVDGVDGCRQLAWLGRLRVRRGRG